MTESQVKEFADSIAAMLIWQAAHGVSTSSLLGLGEISLRDATIVSKASIGARLRQAWLLLREQSPDDWSDAAIDVVVARRLPSRVRWVAGVELKWWRQSDSPNAGNRRRELVRDFLEAASLYPRVEDASLVALLSTAESWSRTANTRGNDAEVMSLIKEPDLQRWNIVDLSAAPAVRNAARALNVRVAVPTLFRSEMLSTASLVVDKQTRAVARVWRVWKHQNTRFLTAQEIDAL